MFGQTCVWPDLRNGFSAALQPILTSRQLRARWYVRSPLQVATFRGPFSPKPPFLNTPIPEKS